MLKITLVDRQCKDVAQVEVTDDKIGKIADAACVVYGGRHYKASSCKGRHYSGAVFMEVESPVHIGEQGGVC